MQRNLGNRDLWHAQGIPDLAWSFLVELMEQGGGSRELVELVKQFRNVMEALFVVCSL
jgi:hypothetical protein